jgi:hypothetical protein
MSYKTIDGCTLTVGGYTLIIGSGNPRSNGHTQTVSDYTLMSDDCTLMIS